MPAPEIVDAVRVVASPATLDGWKYPSDTVVMRLAPDEMLVLETGIDRVAVPDPHAIVTSEDGYAGTELPREAAEAWLRREAEWRLPAGSPSFAQGLAAGLAIKVWADEHRAMVVTRTSLMHELAKRL